MTPAELNFCNKKYTVYFYIFECRIKSLIQKITTLKIQPKSVIEKHNQGIERHGCVAKSGQMLSQVR